MQYFQEKISRMLETCLQFKKVYLLLPSLPENPIVDTAYSTEQSNLSWLICISSEKLATIPLSVYLQIPQKGHFSTSVALSPCLSAFWNEGSGSL